MNILVLLFCLLCIDGLRSRILVLVDRLAGGLKGPGEIAAGVRLEVVESRAMPARTTVAG